MSSPQINPVLRFAAQGDFARILRGRVLEMLREQGETRYGDLGQWSRAALSAAIGFGAYAALLLGIPRHGAEWLSLAVAALAAFFLIVQLGHDASHGSVAKRGWINRAVLFAVFAIVGVDGRLWGDRHIRLHHQYPNLPGTGIDADSVNVMRLAPDKPWRWWNRFQPLYAPLVYSVGHISLVWLEDFATMRMMRRAGRREFIGLTPVLSFIGGKAIHLSLWVLLPLAVAHPSPLSLAAGYLFASSLIAFAFVFLVVGTHVSDLAAFPQPDAAGNVDHDWATHQLVTSIDWAPTSRIATLMSGGSNAHAAHHLFPGYSHRHLDRISAIIAETAAQHGLPHHVTSLNGLVLSHCRHLVVLSRPDASGTRSLPRFGTGSMAAMVRKASLAASLALCFSMTGCAMHSGADIGDGSKFRQIHLGSSTKEDLMRTYGPADHTNRSSDGLETWRYEHTEVVWGCLGPMGLYLDGHFCDYRKRNYALVATIDNRGIVVDTKWAFNDKSLKPNSGGQ